MHSAKPAEPVKLSDLLTNQFGDSKMTNKTLREAGAMALDALLSATPFGGTVLGAQADAAHKKHSDAIEALRSAIAQPAAQPTPEGYKLVPLEPTSQQAIKGQVFVPAGTAGSACVARDIYRAMLDAAPQPAHVPEADCGNIAQPVQPAVNLDKVHPEWEFGQSPFKDWCSQWFGPDSDEAHLAKAVLCLPYHSAQPVQPAEGLFLKLVASHGQEFVEEMAGVLAQPLQSNTLVCRKCAGNMKTGQAMAQTFSAGRPDFPGDAHGVTMSPGGPGKLIECLKCEVCGWSVTAR